MHWLETAAIILALLSFWPIILGRDWANTNWYRVWLVLVLAAMIWVARRRIMRICDAAAEEKKKHDEAQRAGRQHR